PSVLKYTRFWRGGLTFPPVDVTSIRVSRAGTAERPPRCTVAPSRPRTTTAWRRRGHPAACCRIAVAGCRGSDRSGMIPFVKGHGLGNDYLVIDAADVPGGALSERGIVHICD